MTEHLSILIDDKNKDLWHAIGDIFEVKLVRRTEQNYYSSVTDNIATIGINEHDLNAVSFTHELLRVYLNSKNVKIVEDFNKAIESHEGVNSLFSMGLKIHIATCLEQELMLPIFLKMGYENRFFTSDFHTPKMTKKMLTLLLKRYQKEGVYDREAIDFYMGIFFAMKSCNNEAFKYHKFFLALQELDKELYVLLSEFWLDWKTFDVEDHDDSYDKIVQYFIEDLIGWCSNKTIKNNQLH